MLDQQVQLRTCNISVRANPFIATTEVEMEFYNERDQEVEATPAVDFTRLDSALILLTTEETVAPESTGGGKKP